MKRSVIRILSILCTAALCSACSCLEYAPPAKNAFYAEPRIEPLKKNKEFKPMGTVYIVTKSNPDKEYRAIEVTRKGNVYKATTPMLTADENTPPVDFSVTAGHGEVMAGLEVTFRF